MKSIPNKKIRVIAYYLPQYHPIPENDEWWGKGFTEWTNVGKARPLFFGHYQPHVPADLGYYDLRVSETRLAQAKMAKNAGIEGFCYWHYWFGNGKRLLERPFNEVLESGEPDFPFCLGWANESWSGIWHGAKDKILMEQKYPGIEDYELHFNSILPAFKDKRYIMVNNKPLFVLYRPYDIPDINEFSQIFNNLAIKNGFDGVHLVGVNVNVDWNPIHHGFNAVSFALHGGIVLYGQTIFQKIKRVIFRKKKLLHLYQVFSSKPWLTYKYKNAIKYFTVNQKFDYPYYPTIVSGWDNTPRSGKNGMVYTGYNPDIFKLHVKDALQKALLNEDGIVFIKSWNEWAEGNHMEPDIKHGNAFLDVLKEELEAFNKIL